MSVNCRFIELPPVPEREGSDRDNVIWHGITANLSIFYHRLYHLLNNDEKAAAARYRNQPDRESYVVRHGVLRLLLGRQLNIPADALVFRFNQNNKPYLKAIGARSCFFNLSHSGGEFLIAIGKDELGIDIEKVDPAFEWQDIASTYFSAAEVDYIATAPKPTQAFFLLWTRKEALIKARGMGIDDNLPAVPALDGLHQLPGYWSEKEWKTDSFTFSHNFVASITYPSPVKNLKVTQIEAEMVQALSQTAG